MYFFVFAWKINHEKPDNVVTDECAFTSLFGYHRFSFDILDAKYLYY
jgi:hypothetical protein